MPNVTVLYTHEAILPGDSATVRDALLERLGLLVGPELALGWTVIAIEPDHGSLDSWRATLEHENDDTTQTVMHRIAEVNDARLRLSGEEAVSPNHVAPPAPPVVIEPLSLPVPRDVPSILKDSDAVLGRRAAVRGIVTGILLSVAMGLLAPAKSAPQLMFDPRTPSAAVTTAILCLLFWGIFHGLNRRMRLRAIDKLNGADLLPAVLGGLKTHGPKGLMEALNGDAVQHSPFLRRVRLILEQWLIRPDLPNANIVIEQQVISDREATQRGYTLLRIFVWATPVLGLIGTVVGISIAVGGFAAFLSTNVDDIEKIKSGLVGVTGGLSFAFLITLEGLLSSLLLMLFTANIQTREERLFAGIEEGIAEAFLPELQRVAPEKKSGAEAPTPVDWTDHMAEAARKVMEVIDAAGKQMLAKWDDQHRAYVSDLGAVRETVEQSAQNVATVFNNASVAMGTQMGECIAAQKTMIERMLEGARQGLESCNAEMHRSTQVVVGSLNGATGEVGEHLRGVVSALDDAAAQHRAITQEALADSRQTLAGYSSDITRASEAVSELGKVTSQVLQSQAALHVAMAQLGDSRLASLMADLDSSLKDLKPLLSNLSQPFVLQAVPVPSRAASAGGDGLLQRA